MTATLAFARTEQLARISRQPITNDLGVVLSSIIHPEL